MVIAEIEPQVADMVVERLNKDLRQAARNLGDAEARYLVDTYYQVQHNRIRLAHQARSLEEGAGGEILDWYFRQQKTIEGQIKSALDYYTDGHEIGRWMKSITGIGPIISAGLIAHLDIEKAHTAGHFWSFAGLNPKARWEKGEKRPWNASLKVICWKAADSFWKFHNHPKDFYGKLMVSRKEYEATLNQQGAFETQAAAILTAKRIGKSTEAHKAYSVGQLPDGHIHARALRWGAKLFLSHVHHVMYELRHGKEPPRPYILVAESDAHTHYIPPPNWPM